MTFPTFTEIEISVNVGNLVEETSPLAGKKIANLWRRGDGKYGNKNGWCANLTVDEWHTAYLRLH